MPVGLLQILNVQVTPDNGTGDGTAIVQKTNTTGGITYYKIDDSVYQTSATFTGLSNGYHTAHVRSTVGSTVYNDSFEFYVDIDTVGGTGGSGGGTPIELYDKYIMQFTSVHTGLQNILRIRKQGFDGEATYITGTDDPVILKHELIDMGLPDKFSTIYSSRLEIGIVTSSLLEYDEFFDFDDREYLAILEENGTEIWRGYLVTDSYSESYVGAPSIVNISATDGLRNLQNEPFLNDAGNFYAYYQKESLFISEILKKTGLNLNIHDSVNIYEDNMDSDSTQYSPFKQAYINCEMHNDYEKGTSDDCLKVLHNILLKYNAFLVQENGVWNIRRIDAIDQNYVKRRYDIDWNLAGVYQSINPVKNFSKVSDSFVNFSQRSQNLDASVSINKIEVTRKTNPIQSLVDGEFIYRKLSDGDYEDWGTSGAVQYNANNQAVLIKVGATDSSIYHNQVQYTNAPLKLRIKYLIATNDLNPTFKVTVFSSKLKWLDENGEWQESTRDITINASKKKQEEYELDIEQMAGYSEGEDMYLRIDITNSDQVGSIYIDYVRLQYGEYEEDEVFTKKNSSKTKNQLKDIEFLHSDFDNDDKNKYAYYGCIFTHDGTSFQTTTNWSDWLYEGELIDIFINKIMYDLKRPLWKLTGTLLYDTPINFLNIFYENSKYFLPVRMSRSIKKNFADVELHEYLTIPEVADAVYLGFSDTGYIGINNTDLIKVSD